METAFGVPHLRAVHAPHDDRIEPNVNRMYKAGKAPLQAPHPRTVQSAALCEQYPVCTDLHAPQRDLMNLLQVLTLGTEMM